MTAVVSAPVALAGIVGAVLSRSCSVRIHECPEIDRVYFAVPVDEWFARCRFPTGVDISYFGTERGAMAWGNADAERRLGGDEE